VIVKLEKTFSDETFDDIHPPLTLELNNQHMAILKNKKGLSFDVLLKNVSKRTIVFEIACRVEYEFNKKRLKTKPFSTLQKMELQDTKKIKIYTSFPENLSIISSDYTLTFQVTFFNWETKKSYAVYTASQTSTFLNENSDNNYKTHNNKHYKSKNARVEPPKISIRDNDYSESADSFVAIYIFCGIVIFIVLGAMILVFLNLM
jgi:hypothetical protein